MGCTAFTNREYTPWGDSWFEYTTMDVYHQMNIPFRFTGKELDQTQLYYYGARYYSPAASVWMSTDAAIVDYIDGMHFSGIYKSQNINLYGYSYQSPIVFKDPDGNVAQYGNQIDFVTDEQILLAKAIKEESVLGYLEHATKLILANFAQVVVDSTTNLADRLSSGAIGLIKDPHDEGAKEKLLGASAELLLSSVAAKTFTAANANRELLKKPISDMPKKAKINFGFGKATAEQADKIGKSYVGNDSRPMSSGKGTISNDKTRAYRDPEYKRRIGKTQANIEYNTNPGGTDNKRFNGHIDIVEDK